MTARFNELDTVVLLRDLPESGLRLGDLGAVVQVYGREAVEVEFVTASGRTHHGVDFLLTWNVAHIANAALRRRVEDVCRGHGYQAPILCTPDELMEDGHE